VYVINIDNLMPEYEVIKRILVSSLTMNVGKFDCRYPQPYSTGETIFCCERKYATNRLQGFLVLYNWYTHDNESWNISQTTESDIHHILEGPMMAALRGFNFNFFESEWALEGISRSLLGHHEAWVSNSLIGKFTLAGITHEVTDFGKSFKSMLGEPLSCTTLERNWGGNMYLYETNNYYVLHEFWAAD
jgi:hypothetical protein